ncbi:hypothetical protein BDZ97DRAFT_1756973 [Flammula alnicola]|nr:hypothetical protein BDZ97DRAFT_1756973 [Flammula alnicola]
MPPVDNARYNSSYSTTIEQHGFTAETPEKILEDPKGWVVDRGEEGEEGSDEEDDEDDSQDKRMQGPVTKSMADFSLNEEGYTRGRHLNNVQVTTCYITAERALQHLRNKTNEIAGVFRKWKIQESEYMLFAGFDESLIQAGVGYLEQVHVVTSADLAAPASLFEGELGTIFSPFSAILFTKSSPLPSRIPVFKHDGSAWDFDEFVHLNTSRFVGGRSGAPTPPVLTSLSQTPDKAESLKGFSQKDPAKQEEDGSKEKDSDKGKDRDKGNEDKADKGGEEDEDPAGDLEEPGSSETRKLPKVTFDILSEIYSSNDDSEQDLNVFQSLTMEGALTIQTTPPNPNRPDDYPTCEIEFQKLNFSSHPTTKDVAYRQFCLWIAIDPQERNTDITVIQPQQTIAFEREAKEISSKKTTWTGGGVLAVASGLKTQVTLSGTAARASEVAAGTEKNRYTSPITQQNKLGVACWRFTVDDDQEQKDGMKMPKAILPTVNFEFLGDSDVPGPPPELLDIEVASCWSLFSPKETNWTWLQTLFQPKSEPRYSNLCHIVILKVPSNLAKRSDYRATLHVNPGHNKSTFCTEVRRKVGSVEATPAISWGHDRSSAEFDLRKHSLLKLPTFTHGSSKENSSDTQPLQELGSNS